MPQINAGEFKKGVKVIVEGEPYEMIECNFVKPGKGQALYKTRLRHLIRGTLLDRTYKSGDGLEGADVRKNDGKYMYRDATGYHFMDNETFEHYSLSNDVVGDTGKFMLEDATCGLLFWNDQLIGMTPPQHVNLKITYTEPAVRGNTSSNITKEATVETGATMFVPSFIEIGDTVKVEASTGTYVERVRA